MKTLVFLFCLLSTTAVFAQYSNLGGTGRNTEPTVYYSPSHPAQASYVAIGSGRSVLSGAGYSSAQGERPASDFPQPDAVSLGVMARELRKQHADDRKTYVVWVNQ